MSKHFQNSLKMFNKPTSAKNLVGFKCGLEREALRVEKDGSLAQNPHPKCLGSSLYHRYVTTDFSEAQLELVTPPVSSVSSAINYMNHLHCFVSKHLGEQMLWPFSMPSVLPDEKKIPIADFGKSHKGKEKTLYRQGLADRYGRKMQTVSGVHYNLSFSDKLWQFLHKKEKSKQDLDLYKSEKYFHIIRNFLKISWVNTYLFGSTPAADKSYFQKIKKPLKKHKRRTYITPHGTSLRMSNMGYFSKVQSQINISYNSLDQYLKDMEKAISTPEKSYRKTTGLNTNMLQIPAEHYSRIRPKKVDLEGVGVIESLRSGVEYLEIRALDLNPFLQTGQDKSQLLFLNCLITYCLFLDSPKLTKKSIKELTQNQLDVALYGRKPELKLSYRGRPRALQSWIQDILDDLMEVAKILDLGDKTNLHSKAIEKQMEKLKHPSLLPSARIVHELEDKNIEFIDLAMQLANEQKEQFCSTKTPSTFIERQQKEAEASLLLQKNAEIYDQTYLKGYEDLELSTQLLLKEAAKRKIQFEILDRKSNFIRLKKGRKTELVMQATFTAYDSQITHFLMENKIVSKKILAEQNLRVPLGDNYNKITDAMADYAKFKAKKIVVKPSDTNFGKGITFVNANAENEYTEALRTAFSHSNSVIVEEFIPGDEYRFLVIDRKCVAVINRVPANVMGNGKSTISELVKEKNEDYQNFKFFPGYQIKLEKEEKEFFFSRLRY